MSSDGECDGNSDRAAGLGSDTAVTKLFPRNLMDFTDDLLAGMFRSLAVEHDALTLEHDSLAFFVRVKLVSRRVMSLIRNRLHAEYQAALHALAYFVPGTRIPCGATTVLPVPSPVDWDETWNIFQDNLVLAPNGLEVGGPFNYHSMFFTESVEMEVADDGQREFLLLVQTDWYDVFQDIYNPTLWPAGGMCDVSRLPNNLRSSMGHLELTVSYDSVMQDGMGFYYQFVRVRENTTMQEVFDAIAFVEGWHLPTYNMCIGEEEIDSAVDVLGSMEIGDDEQWRPAINWPPLSIRIERVDLQQPMIQVHTTISMLQGPVSDSDDNKDKGTNDQHTSGDRKD